MSTSIRGFEDAAAKKSVGVVSPDLDCGTCHANCSMALQAASLFKVRRNQFGGSLDRYLWSEFCSLIAQTDHAGHPSV